MANILLLLVMFMFVFAVIGVSFFSTDSPEYFGTLDTGLKFSKSLGPSVFKHSACV